MVKKYGLGSRRREKLRQYYPGASNPLSQPQSADPESQKDWEVAGFYSPSDPYRCRVFEVWTKEVRTRYRCHDWARGELFIVDDSDKLMLKEIDVMNESRRLMYAQRGFDPAETPVIDMTPYNDEYWHYRHLTPDGYVLEEGDSQLEGGVHPFSICAIPLINGNISGFMADKVNYQRAVNRFLMLDDWVRRAGAKGITMVDTRLVPDNMDPEEFAEAFTQVGGILLYTGKPGVETPKQFYGSTQSLDTVQMVQLFKTLLDDSSAAGSGALQGKTPYSGTSAALYAQQSQNASTGLVALYETFNTFIETAALKKLRVIEATYEPELYRVIAGRLANALPQDFEYESMGDIEYTLSVKQAAETPVLRMLANDQLKEMWMAGQITLEEYLKYGDLWFADDLLQGRAAQAQAQQQAMEQQQQMGGGGAPPEEMPPTKTEPGFPEPTKIGRGGKILDE